MTENMQGILASQALRNAAHAIAANGLLISYMIEGEIPEDAQLSGSGSSANGRRRLLKRKQADDSQPKKKRPLTAYLLFSGSVRPAVKASLPSDAKPPQVMKACADRWKQLSADEKDAWKQQANNLATANEASPDAPPSADAEDQLDADDALAAAPASTRAAEPEASELERKKKKKKKKAAAE
eukprot:CAMPEP_0174717374 /NCGR_PEP_ID=MMETSP1094-20130205/26395_1 /TAXON_ID=156173 /ORGANISM="Chrysochromulina brevifilum, Strain UTEX LB 985" /LENGTH=182 /DNA_ID=CAMNT_0015917293 /DNA_START=75 /DNA_END=623 /DNA_ORIENTATION=+